MDSEAEGINLTSLFLGVDGSKFSHNLGTKMAACRLLQCPELLAEIFSHLELAANPNDVDDTHTAKIDLGHQELRKTLAAAALSCRALTEHALAILWRRLDSLLPLLSLLSKPNRRHPKTNLTVSHLSTLRTQILTRRRCFRQILLTSPGCVSRPMLDVYECCMLWTGLGFIPLPGLSLDDGAAQRRSYPT